MDTKALEFITNVASGKNNDPSSKFQLFATNGRKTVVLGKNQVGMYWANRLNNSNFAHPKQACNNAQQGNVTP